VLGPTLSSTCDVLYHAIDQVRRTTHPDAAILAVGDTPADIVAARSNNLPVIAVATGNLYVRAVADRGALSLPPLFRRASLR